MKAIVLSGGLAMLLAAGCSHNVSLESAANHLDVADTTSIAYSGTGHWHWFGQPPVPGSPWLAFKLIEFNTVISYTLPAAQVDITRVMTVDPARARPAREHRVSQFVAGTHAWGVFHRFPGMFPHGMATPSGPFAQPAALDERLVEIWSSPHGFIKAALSNQATSKPMARGKLEVTSYVGRNKLVGIINARNEVEKVQTWVYSPASGDTPVEFSYSNYKNFGEIKFPGRIVQTQGGYPVLEIDVTAVTPNPHVTISAPESVTRHTVSPIQFETLELAKGVHLILTGTSSVVIDQADHIIVVEAPGNEAYSEAVIAKAKQLVPGKSIRYIVNSHSHFDHAGGLRTYVDEGATIVTHELNKPYYEKLWTAPHTLSPDRLSKSGKVPSFETVGDKHVLTDGKRSIELHLVAGSGHADGFLMAFLPAEKIVIGGTDGYLFSAPGSDPPAEPDPFAVNFYDNIKRLKLDVATIAPLHGRVGTMADLRHEIGLSEVPSKE